MSNDPDTSIASSSGLTPKQRRLRARLAAHASWAKTPDRVARTSRGTQAFLERFERQVDPERKLPPEVRREMAIHARTAYMLQLAQRSAAARRRKPRRYNNDGD
ncbi:hypothetical protein [Amycolatopsis pigmentata]|uniref:DUF3263 domain-containing protein n=1 Tax=Amycolatopsis pigmentata TaxID=450801 RepID=A0ABW5FJ35_9PSEU